MAGYTSFWDCDRCGERQETIDSPRCGAPALCHRCDPVTSEVGLHLDDIPDAIGRLASFYVRNRLRLNPPDPNTPLMRQMDKSRYLVQVVQQIGL